MSRLKVTMRPGGQSSHHELGLALFRDARTPEALAVALDALPTTDPAVLRQAFGEKYAGYAAQSGRGDQGYFQRVLLLKSWRL